MVNDVALTVKKEHFARAFVETSNQSEAYRRAYNTSKMKTETIAKRASELMQDGEVAGMVAELKAVHAKRHAVTVDSLIAELEEARNVALDTHPPQSSAAVAATMGKAKLCGLDKQLVELSGNVGVNLTTAQRTVLDKALDDGY